MNAEFRMQNVKCIATAFFSSLFLILTYLFIVSVSLARAATPPCCVISGACQGNYSSEAACTDALNTWDPGCTSAACNTVRPPDPPPAASAGSASSVIGLPNPLGTSDPTVIIGRIIKTFTGFAGSIGLLMFVYGGFIWLTSFGNPERIKKGQDLLLWTTIGLAIMFSSYIVARYILTAVTRGTGTL